MIIQSYRGMGDGSTDFTTFAEGSTLTAFAIGIGIIVVFKMMASKPKHHTEDKVWSRGAYRSRESASYYEDLDKLQSKRRRGKRK